MAAKKSKSAKWKVGVGLEMVQHLLSLCEAKLSHPGKGAGPAARRENVTATLEAFTGKFDENVYTFTKLDKVLSALCKRVSCGRPTGNHYPVNILPQFG